MGLEVVVIVIGFPPINGGAPAAPAFPKDEGR
jgi:hypothetical protein